jgi:hypothetical protein
MFANHSYPHITRRFYLTLRARHPIPTQILAELNDDEHVAFGYLLGQALERGFITYEDPRRLEKTLYRLIEIGIRRGLVEQDEFQSSWGQDDWNWGAGMERMGGTHPGMMGRMSGMHGPRGGGMDPRMFGGGRFPGRMPAMYPDMFGDGGEYPENNFPGMAGFDPRSSAESDRHCGSDTNFDASNISGKRSGSGRHSQPPESSTRAPSGGSGTEGRPGNTSTAAGGTPSGGGTRTNPYTGAKTRRGGDPFGGANPFTNSAGADPPKDLYAILNLTKTASAEEIKRAGRDLQRKWHPDKNKAANADEKIREINEAVEVLGNGKRKLFYDETGNTNESAMQAHEEFKKHMGCGLGPEGNGRFGGMGGR